MDAGSGRSGGGGGVGGRVGSSGIGSGGIRNGGGNHGNQANENGGNLKTSEHDEEDVLVCKGKDSASSVGPFIIFWLFACPETDQVLPHVTTSNVFVTSMTIDHLQLTEALGFLLCQPSNHDSQVACGAQ